MSISLQTNVTSLVAQNNLRINTNFQSQTIQRLTSGYRINSSGDDAAGLALANKYASDTAELSQGVRNANDAIGAFQQIDTGLANISQILQRLRTLATQSAAGTFTGDRGTLNTEYQTLLGEVNRQAANIHLDNGGNFNSNLIVYIGGGNNLGNSQVNVDLSGTQNTVDATGLGVNATSVDGGGTELAGNTVNLSDPASTFLVGAGSSQALTLNVYNSVTGAAETHTVTVNGAAGGISGTQVLAQLNKQLSQYGLSASTGSDGKLQLGGSTAFSVSAGAVAGGGTSAFATAATTAANASNYSFDHALTAIGAGESEVLTIQNAGKAYSVTLDSTSGATAASAIAALNTQLAGSGIYAVTSTTTGNLQLQSQNAFSITEQTPTASGGTGLVPGGAGTVGTVTAASTTASSTGNAIAALDALTTAVQNLGIVQGRVGAGENKLSYAVNLAQSQITNFSAAGSQIRDADVAAEAANLTKAQVLQQSSIAALAQANSAPQAILSLLKG